MEIVSREESAKFSITTATLNLKDVYPRCSHIDRAVYHLESALYQLQHPTNEIPQTKTDATSV